MLKYVQKRKSDAEIKIFTAIINADKRYIHLKDIIMVGLHTAMRMGEILGMQKNWIDLKAGIINVPRYSQKRGKRDKRAPINSVIRPIIAPLMKQNKDSQFLFVDPKTGTKFTSLQNAWDTILKKAGLEG